MPYFNERFRGVRTKDHDTYEGYPSEHFMNRFPERSKLHVGDLGNELQVRLAFKKGNNESANRMKYYSSIKIDDSEFTKKYHQTAISRDIKNVKKRRG